MSFKTGNRNQSMLLPPSIDDYVGESDPVHAYDAIVDCMNFKELGIDLNSSKIGPSSYDPVSMLKLLVYGYSYGIRSSRKLERALYHNLSFVWLMGGLKPDHKTIARFRKDNKKSLQKILKESARICLKLNLIEGNCLFVDGTKMRAAASINKSYTKEGLDSLLAKIDKRIIELLNECETIDNAESGSYVEVSKDLCKAKNLKVKVNAAKESLNASGKEKINLTDPDAVNVKGRQGTHAGFNGQAVVDGENGLIVGADVVSENNDLNQFTQQINNANENLPEDCKVAVGDAGYAKIDNIANISDEIDVVVPNQKQAAHKPKKDPFSKDNFKYDDEKDTYTCPDGKILKYSRFSKNKNCHEYKIIKAKTCKNCKHYGTCTTSKVGRTISRLPNEELKEKLAERYESEEGQEIYSRRKEVAELPFGHIKRNLGADHFLVKGLEAVKAEFSILTSCFNIARMITLKGGVLGLVQELKAI